MKRTTSSRLLFAGALIAVSALTLGASSAPARSLVTQSTVPPGAAPSVQPRTVVVHGIGRVSQVPDRATLTIGVETRAATAAAALSDNNTKAAQLIKVLKDRGVQAKDIQTANLSVYPQYDNQGRRITSYQVTNTVSATVRQLSDAGSLIDAAASVTGDAFRVNGISFSISDNAKALATARAAAVADARTTAEQLAAAAGVKLGALRTISSSTSSVPTPVVQQLQAARVADAAVPIEAGSQEVTAEVDLVFDMA